jgi:hypothetical protein
MQDASISQIVREQLAALTLDKIPPLAVAILSQKLESQLRKFATKSITPRAVARAVLSSAQPKPSTTESILKGGLLNRT